MKYLLTIFLLLATLSVSAQKKKQKEPEPPIEELFDAYRFDDAARRLRSEIETLKRRRKPTDELEQQLEYAERMNAQCELASKVVFVDSVVVAKEAFFEHFDMSDESGVINTYERTFHTNDTLGCLAFQSELGSETYFAMPTEQGTPMLFRASKQGSQYSEPEPLPGLDWNDTAQNYPFMLSDGVTIYYGAVNEAGLGGYDIYTSRWDADSKRFLRPENLGMPFNSPANDYMLAIDEYNKLGWFVTDRRQPADSVCIYVFVPSDVRCNWLEVSPQPSSRQMSSLAALSCIRDTQTDSVAVADALARLEQARHSQRQKAKTYDFIFVVSDNRVLHSLGEAPNNEVRDMLSRWDKEEKELRDAEMQLDMLRQQYAKANDASRAQMRARILTMERDYEQRLAAQKRLKNDIILSF